MNDLLREFGTIEAVDEAVRHVRHAHLQRAIDAVKRDGFYWDHVLCRPHDKVLAHLLCEAGLAVLHFADPVSGYNLFTLGNVDYESLLREHALRGRIT